MTPRQATTNRKVCSLQTDNWDTSEGWIIVDECDVTLSTQRHGEDSTGKVTFSRRQFNALVDWYMREQKARKR